MLDREIAESSDGVSIGNLIARFYAAKIRKGATVHNLVAGTLVGLAGFIVGGSDSGR